MLCEKCQQKQATVHMQQILNGEKTEIYLCQECAGQLDMPISFDNFFQGFLDSFISMPGKNAYEGVHINKKCPACGLGYDGFKKAGRLGCANCYETFSEELDGLLKNVQGSNQHNGKFPRKYGAELLSKRNLDKLKLQLSKAIDNEEYEEAAKLRDRIKEIQKGVE